MEPLSLGDLSVQRVEEMIWVIKPSFLLADITAEQLEPHRHWLVPRFCTDTLRLKVSIHTFVVRAAGLTVVVDTCVGNGKERRVREWNQMETDFLERLARAGVRPEAVDYVFCTHLHPDHVGWNTRREDGCWVPTFPNARYLFHRKEWDFWEQDRRESRNDIADDSLTPILEAGLADFVEGDHQLAEGIRLEPTPGHTPGHCAVHLTAGGRDAVITGDLIHHPVQLAEPDWASVACVDPRQAGATRRAFLERYAEAQALILGTHFPPPTALRVRKKGKGFEPIWVA